MTASHRYQVETEERAGELDGLEVAAVGDRRRQQRVRGRRRGPGDGLRSRTLSHDPFRRRIEGRLKKKSKMF
jgi:hypothetical protein